MLHELWEYANKKCDFGEVNRHETDKSFSYFFLVFWAIARQNDILIRLHTMVGFSDKF